MTDKFMPGDAVVVGVGVTFGSVDVPDDQIAWIVGKVESFGDQWYVRFAAYPDHPQGRPWRVRGDTLTRLKAGDETND